MFKPVFVLFFQVCGLFFGANFPHALVHALRSEQYNDDICIRWTGGLAMG